MTDVKAHPRKGSRGVRRHRRKTNKHIGHRTGRYVVKETDKTAGWFKRRGRGTKRWANRNL
jgi:hypothetical protein